MASEPEIRIDELSVGKLQVDSAVDAPSSIGATAVPVREAVPGDYVWTDMALIPDSAPGGAPPYTDATGLDYPPVTREIRVRLTRQPAPNDDTFVAAADDGDFIDNVISNVISPTLGDGSYAPTFEHGAGPSPAGGSFLAYNTGLWAVDGLSGNVRFNDVADIDALVAAGSTEFYLNYWQYTGGSILDTEEPTTVPDTLTLYVDDGGSDTADGLTSGTPFATLERACRELRGRGWNTTAEIVVVGTLTVPADGVLTLNTGGRGAQRTPVMVRGTLSAGANPAVTLAGAPLASDGGLTLVTTTTLHGWAAGDLVRGSTALPGGGPMDLWVAEVPTTTTALLTWSDPDGLLAGGQTFTKQDFAGMLNLNGKLVTVRSDNSNVVFKDLLVTANGAQTGLVADNTTVSTHGVRVNVSTGDFGFASPGGLWLAGGLELVGVAGTAVTRAITKGLQISCGGGGALADLPRDAAPLAASPATRHLQNCLVLGDATVAGHTFSLLGETRDSYFRACGPLVTREGHHTMANVAVSAPQLPATPNFSRDAAVQVLRGGNLRAENVDIDASTSSLGDLQVGVLAANPSGGTLIQLDTVGWVNYATSVGLVNGGGAVLVDGATRESVSVAGTDPDLDQVTVLVAVAGSFGVGSSLVLEQGCMGLFVDEGSASFTRLAVDGARNTNIRVDPGGRLVVDSAAAETALDTRNSAREGIIIVGGELVVEDLDGVVTRSIEADDNATYGVRMLAGGQIISRPGLTGARVNVANNGYSGFSMQDGCQALVLGVFSTANGGNGSDLGTSLAADDIQIHFARQAGVYVGRSELTTIPIRSNSSGGSGLLVDQQAVVRTGSIECSNNGINGVHVSRSSAVRTSNITANSNMGNGLLVEFVSDVQADGSISTTGNTLNGVAAAVSAGFSTSGENLIRTATFNSANNTQAGVRLLSASRLECENAFIGRGGGFAIPTTMDAPNGDGAILLEFSSSMLVANALDARSNTGPVNVDVGRNCEIRVGGTVLMDGANSTAVVRVREGGALLADTLNTDMSIGNHLGTGTNSVIGIEMSRGGQVRMSGNIFMTGLGTAIKTNQFGNSFFCRGDLVIVGDPSNTSPGPALDIDLGSTVEVSGDVIVGNHSDGLLAANNSQIRLQQTLTVDNRGPTMQLNADPGTGSTLTGDTNSANQARAAGLAAGSVALLTEAGQPSQAVTIDSFPDGQNIAINQNVAAGFTAAAKLVTTELTPTGTFTGVAPAGTSITLDAGGVAASQAAGLKVGDTIVIVEGTTVEAAEVGGFSGGEGITLVAPGITLTFTTAATFNVLGGDGATGVDLLSGSTLDVAGATIINNQLTGISAADNAVVRIQDTLTLAGVQSNSVTGIVLGTGSTMLVAGDANIADFGRALDVTASSQFSCRASLTAERTTTDRGINVDSGATLQVVETLSCVGNTGGMGFYGGSATTVSVTQDMIVTGSYTDNVYLSGSNFGVSRFLIASGAGAGRADSDDVGGTGLTTINGRCTIGAVLDVRDANLGDAEGLVSVSTLAVDPALGAISLQLAAGGVATAQALGLRVGGRIRVGVAPNDETLTVTGFPGGDVLTVTATSIDHPLSAPVQLVTGDNLGACHVALQGILSVGYLLVADHNNSLGSNSAPRKGLTIVGQSLARIGGLVADNCTVGLDLEESSFLLTTYGNQANNCTGPQAILVDKAVFKSFGENPAGVNTSVIAPYSTMASALGYNNAPDLQQDLLVTGSAGAGISLVTSDVVASAIQATEAAGSGLVMAGGTLDVTGNLDVSSFGNGVGNSGAGARITGGRVAVGGGVDASSGSINGSDPTFSAAILIEGGAVFTAQAVNLASVANVSGTVGAGILVTKGSAVTVDASGAGAVAIQGIADNANPIVPISVDTGARLTVVGDNVATAGDVYAIDVDSNNASAFDVRVAEQGVLTVSTVGDVTRNDNTAGIRVGSSTSVGAGISVQSGGRLLCAGTIFYAGGNAKTMSATGGAQWDSGTLAILGSPNTSNATIVTVTDGASMSMAGIHCDVTPNVGTASLVSCDRAVLKLNGAEVTYNGNTSGVAGDPSLAATAASLVAATTNSQVEILNHSIGASGSLSAAAFASDDSEMLLDTVSATADISVLAADGRNGGALRIATLTGIDTTAGYAVHVQNGTDLYDRGDNTLTGSINNVLIGSGGITAVHDWGATGSLTYGVNADGTTGAELRVIQAI